MRTFVVLMRMDSGGEQDDNYVASFTKYNEAEEFIRKEDGENSIIHRIEKDYDGFHYYIPGYTEERFDTGIYGILMEEV